MNITYSVKIDYMQSNRGYSGELEIKHQNRSRKLYFTVLVSETERVFTFFFKENQKDKYFSKKIEVFNSVHFLEPAKTPKTLLIQLVDDFCDTLDALRDGVWAEKIAEDFSASWGPLEMCIYMEDVHRIKLSNLLYKENRSRNSTS